MTTKQNIMNKEKREKLKKTLSHFIHRDDFVVKLNSNLLFFFEKLFKGTKCSGNLLKIIRLFLRRGWVAR